MIRLLMAALCLSCSALWAQEQARVLSTTPSYIPVLSNPVYVMPYPPPYYHGNPLPFTFNFGLGYYRWRR